MVRELMMSLRAQHHFFNAIPSITYIDVSHVWKIMFPKAKHKMICVFPKFIFLTLGELCYQRNMFDEHAFPASIFHMFGELMSLKAKHKCFAHLLCQCFFMFENDVSASET